MFVPWNTCGVFIASTLGVSVVEYAPFAILNYTVPIISIIFGYIGFKIIGLDESEGEQSEHAQSNDTNLA